MAYQIPPLGFGYNELEPHISEFVLQRHHQLHHPLYVERLNAALADYPDLGGKTIEQLLRLLPKQPAETQAALLNVAGGHANHQFQWKIISPLGGGAPTGPFADAIDHSFGSFAGFTQQFTGAALAHVGSGWAFLSVSALGTTDLEIVILPNNQSVLPIGKPGILVCDLWEHAYEAQYPAAREAYLRAFFKVADWRTCGERYDSFAAGRMHPG